uniref:Ig-like domain-containing protein n=1 Tax=Denticeps clupeoides TaxID=299321 RepID=A0AAY4A0U7_9TELE
MLLATHFPFLTFSSGVALPQYDVVYGQVGGAASFNCEQWGDYLNWYFGNTSEETATLIYNKHALGPIKVTLSDPPSVFINDMLTLNCDVETNDPMPKIRWIPPDSVTDQRAKYVAQLKGPELSFRDPTWKDNGVWTCLLKYDSKKTNATATVRVLDLSPPLSKTVYTSVSPSSSLILPCSLSSAIEWATVMDKGLQGGEWNFRPWPSHNNSPNNSTKIASLSLGPPVKWETPSNLNFDGSLLHQIPVGNLSLVKKGVGAEDRGTYICAHNCRFNFFTLLSAFVDPGPTAFEGDTVNLTCSLGHPLTSDLKVKWVAPRLGSNETPHLNSQFIFTARQSKAGKYKCELCKGEHIVTSAEVKLKIEKAPVDTWLWVGICSTGLIVIMLIFIGTTLLRRYRKVNING